MSQAENVEAAVREDRRVGVNEVAEISIASLIPFSGQLCAHVMISQTQQIHTHQNLILFVYLSKY